MKFSPSAVVPKPLGRPINYRIAVYTMDENAKAVQEGYDKGFAAGKVEGVKDGEKETWRTLSSVALLGSIIAIAMTHFNNLI